jgi:hypothetical protein
VAAWAAAAGIGAAGRHFLMVMAEPQIRPLLLTILVLPLSVQLAFGARARLLKIRSRGASLNPAAGCHLDPANSANRTHSGASGD